MSTGKGMSPSERLESDHALIASSGLFDAGWYLSQLPDDATSAGADPVRHYLQQTELSAEPSPHFASAWYLATNPDVAAAGRNPFAHFVEWGWRERRDPSPSFSVTAYLRSWPELLAAGFNPLLHAIVQGTVGSVPSAAAATPASSTAVDWDAGLAPLISIILPVYETPLRYLREAIQSVRRQTYPRWELCIVDDASRSPDVAEELERAARSDDRVRIHRRGENGGIAAASQDGLEMCRGDYVAFLDHDDLLKPEVLAFVVMLLREDQDVDYVFTDHVTIDKDGQRLSSSRKPGWSPEFFLSTNYIVHFKVMRRDLVLQVGGFKAEQSVVQDIGLSCRLIEAGARIRHLPVEGYYWRAHSASVASGTSGKPAIETLALATYTEHLRRRGVAARIVWPEPFRTRRLGAYKLDFAGLDAPVSVVVLDPDGVADPRAFERLVAELDWGADLELVFVQGGEAASDEARGPVRRRGKGDDLLPLLLELRHERVVFLAPRCIPMTTDWLRELVGYLGVDPEIGAVGGKVLDHRLHVIDGALVYGETIRVLGQGAPDIADGHWFTNRLASNVEAVSAALMATTKGALRQAGEWRFGEPMESGSRFCHTIRQRGGRVVYNPWARMVQARNLAPAPLIPPSADAYGSAA